MKRITKTAVLCGVLAPALLFATSEAKAYEVLNESVDLNGRVATITNENGATILSLSHREKYELNQDSVLKSSRNVTIKVKTNEPVKIKQIEVEGSLHLKSLCSKETDFTVETDQPVAIKVSNKFHADKINLKASAAEFGIVSNGDFLANCKATVVANGGVSGIVSTEGTVSASCAKVEAIGATEFGILAKNTIKSSCKATLTGTGEQGGVRSTNGSIIANDATIKGSAGDLEGDFSAIHADQQVTRTVGKKAAIQAVCCGNIIEEYREGSIILSPTVPLVINQEYANIGRNMLDLTNYTWSSEPAGVFVKDNGLVIDPNASSSNNGVISATRGSNGKNCCGPKIQEVVYVDNCHSSHTIQFAGLEIIQGS